MKVWKNLKIGRKLMLSFIMVSLIASISGLVGLMVSSAINRDYKEALVVNGFVQGDLGEFDTCLNRGAALVRDMIYLDDQAILNATRDELATLKQETDDALARFRVNCQTPEELALVAVIDENLVPYQEKRQQAIDLGIANDDEEAERIYRDEAMPYLEKCLGAIEDLIDLNVEMGNEVSVKLNRQAMASNVFIIVCIAGSIAVSLGLGAFVSKSISSPIQHCSDRLVLLADGDLHTPVKEEDSRDEAGLMLASLKTTVEKVQGMVQDIGRNLGGIAKGDLNVEAEADYRGDFIAIADSVISIRDSLNRTMTEINNSAQQVSLGSGQLSSGAQSLSQGATEQASSVEELSATISEISEQINDTAENTASAREQTNGAEQEIEKCNSHMGELISAMQDISHSSGEIGKIIKTIEDLAFQTNILALNAAVEAARAGAAGKGFAVVADEVRNLASKSAEASQNTAGLIESAIRAVENGTSIVQETARSLERVVEESKGVANTVDKISDAAREQAISITQVSQGIDQISSVVQVNSATAEETAASSEELSSQAQMLRDMVGRFKLRDE